MNSNPVATNRGTSLPEAPARGPVMRPAATVQRVARLSSQVLLEGANEVEIEHHGALYRLRQTSLGKLILTK